MPALNRTALDRIRSRIGGLSWRLQGKLHHAVARRWVRALQGSLPIPPEIPTEAHGSGGGTYRVCAAPLSGDSVVYSFGVGCDTSFETSLIERYGLCVYAFDPTDESARYLREHPPPPGFVFAQCGLAARDGRVSLRDVKRGNRCYRPGTILEVSADPAGVSEIEVRSLRSLMAQLRHTRIDILKLDIEGAEYEVLESLLEQGVPARQLVLEFHPHLVNLSHSPVMFGRRGWARTEQLIRAICSDGFALAHVSERGTEFSFIREPWSPADAAASHS